MDFQTGFESVAAIVGILGLRELVAYAVRRHLDKNKITAETKILEKELESKDIENRLRILDAMEERINSIIDERAKLQQRVYNLEKELAIYKNKLEKLEKQEAECQKLREQLEKKIEKLTG